MPTVLASQSGQVVVKIKFGGLELTPNLARYDQARIDRSLDSWLIERHVLKFVSLETWRQAYQKLLECDRQAVVQFGLNLGNQVLWQPEEARYVVGIETDGASANSSQYGPTVVITTADNLFKLSLDRQSRAYVGDLTTVLTAMAANCGLGLEWEKTDGRVLSLIQAYQTNFDFLATRASPRLVSAGGLSGYVFYQRSNKLFVHTPAWAACRAWSVSVGTDNAVTDWSIVDRLGAARAASRDGVNLAAFDPLAGELADLKTSADAAAKFSQATWPYARPQISSSHTGVNGAADELAKAQDKFTRARLDAAGGRFVVVNEPGVSPGDIVVVTAPGKDPGAGNYLVKSVGSELTAGNLRSLVTMVRSEVSLTGSAPGVALPAPQPVQPTLAPVQNPRELPPGRV